VPLRIMALTIGSNTAIKYVGPIKCNTLKFALTLNPSPGGEGL
jgi:hypothetical protein